MMVRRRPAVIHEPNAPSIVSVDLLLKEDAKKVFLSLRSVQDGEEET